VSKWTTAYGEKVCQEQAQRWNNIACRSHRHQLCRQRFTSPLSSRPTPPLNSNSLQVCQEALLQITPAKSIECDVLDTNVIVLIGGPLPSSHTSFMLNGLSETAPNTVSSKCCFSSIFYSTVTLNFDLLTRKSVPQHINATSLVKIRLIQYIILKILKYHDDNVSGHKHAQTGKKYNLTATICVKEALKQLLFQQPYY